MAIPNERSEVTGYSTADSSHNKYHEISRKTSRYQSHRAPKKADRVFGNVLQRSVANTFRSQRRKIAAKLGNPRILRISFHTFRHWKATMEYHRTKDILHVKELLGHKRIDNTLIYTHLVNFESDEYHVKVAKTLKEACELAEAGFEYSTTMENAQIFRKRK